MNIQNFSRAPVMCLFFAATAFSQDNLQIDESKTETFFQNDQLFTNLAVKNNSALFYGNVRLEVLNVKDKTVAQNSESKIRFC